MLDKMVGHLIFMTYIAGFMYSVFLIMRAVKNARDGSKQEHVAGASSSTYLFLNLLLWIVERNLMEMVIRGWPAGRLREASTWDLWAPLTLWWPPSILSHWAALSTANRSQLLFLVIGMALCIAVLLSVLRLRNACLPLWMAIFALIPFVNLGLLVFLSVTPSRSCEKHTSDWRDYVFPQNQLGSAVVSCVVTAALGIVCSQFATVVVGSYGWTLFTLVPVVMGFIAACVYGLSEPRSSISCVSVALASVVLGGLAILGFAIEGAVCLLMAAPLALPLAALGGWFGYLVQRRSDLTAQTPQIAGALLLFLPFMMCGEQRSRTEARQIAVSTSVVIHAPADRVWSRVIHLASVPKPDSLIFRSVAYPIKTTLEGTGTGARRECVFSTGSIVEPIEVWNPGHELRFAVISQPPLMRELTPYSDVRPPHLKLEYLRSREGQFTLSPQPDGSTLLTGTSYYESRLWPGRYWQIWTDAIAHQVHRVVLQEIKRQAEQGT
jgi:hypothetical protein